MHNRRKRHGFARTTISIPGELHRRMRACGHRVNWSGIAARAFAEEVGRIYAQSDAAGLDDVVARLQATERRSRGELFERGMAEGEKWAKAQATMAQLRQLWGARREVRAVRAANWENWLHAVDDKKSPAEVLGQIIGCETTALPGAENEGDMKSSEYIHGFAAGALHLWKHVVRRLRGGCDSR